MFKIYNKEGTVVRSCSTVQIAHVDGIDELANVLCIIFLKDDIREKISDDDREIVQGDDGPHGKFRF